MNNDWRNIQRDLDRCDRLNLFCLACLAFALAILGAVIACV